MSRIRIRIQQGEIQKGKWQGGKHEQRSELADLYGEAI
jgi:hypothetical protein